MNTLSSLKKESCLRNHGYPNSSLHWQLGLRPLRICIVVRSHPTAQPQLGLSLNPGPAVTANVIVAPLLSVNCVTLHAQGRNNGTGDRYEVKGNCGDICFGLCKGVVLFTGPLGPCHRSI